MAVATGMFVFVNQHAKHLPEKCGACNCSNMLPQHCIYDFQEHGLPKLAEVYLDE